MTEHAPELDVTHARQARPGRHALVILVVSLTLALLAVFGAWAYYAGRMAAETSPPSAGARPPAALAQQGPGRSG